jgi:hypothetical protein
MPWTRILCARLHEEISRRIDMECQKVERAERESLNAYIKAWQS